MKSSYDNHDDGEPQKIGFAGNLVCDLRCSML